VRTFSRDDGFSLTELMVATAVMLLVMGSALTTVRNAVMVNDSASQLADANQNLRAGTNTLIRDMLMAGRIIGSEGVSVPGGQTFNRPGPPCTGTCPTLTFDLISSDDPNDPTKQMPSITAGYQQGPTINGSATDIVTILTVDEFMPIVTTPPLNPSAPTAAEGTISADGRKVTFASNSLWINGDASNPVTNPNGADTPKIQIGDLVFFKGQFGSALQVVTAKDATSITMSPGTSYDWFNFNPAGSSATDAANKPLYQIKQIGLTPAASLTWPPGATAAPPGMCYQQAPSPTTPFCAQVTLFKAAMITYYVDNTDPTTPRLTRQLNHMPPGCTTASPPSDSCPAKFQPQALAGIVEDLDLTYDVDDDTCNPTAVTFSRSVAWTITCGSPSTTITYTENMIRKVNLHIGVRSETKSKPADDYVRNHISTSVNVRSLTAKDRYNTQAQ